MAPDRPQQKKKELESSDQLASLFDQPIGFQPDGADPEARALLALFFFRRILDHRALSLCVQHFTPLELFFHLKEEQIKEFFAKYDHLRGYVDAAQLADQKNRESAFRYADRMTALMLTSTPGALITAQHPTFPRRLRNSRLGIHWIFGHPRIRNRIPGPAVAIIGSRDSSRLQLEIAREIAQTVGTLRGTVITGLATGADAAAHVAARDTEALLIAVLGSGAAKPYPPSSAPLVAELLSGRGTILTEVPPDYTPNADAFVLRNRIVAALADVVIAVSGKYSSGTAHTVRFAADARIPILSADPDRNSGVSRLITELGGRVISPGELRSGLAREED